MAGRRRTNPFFKFGLPLVLFTVLGYTGLSQFVEGKYDALDHRVKKRSQREFALEEAHKAVVGKLAMEEYTIKPIPKPEDAPAGTKLQ